MPTYDRYPAVDENFQFPPEVRAALGKSPELRNTVVTMTMAERNNLPFNELWDGRLILNTTTDRINRYDANSNTWFSIAEETEAIRPMSEPERNALSGGLLFDGRLILNTTTSRINRYDANTSTWRVVGELSSQGTPSPDGNPTRGTSSESARADHVHPKTGGEVLTHIFTTSGTWVKPTGAKMIRVIVNGGGGGGAAGGLSPQNTHGGGGGGGGGARIERHILADEITASVAVTVGAGGTGGQAGVGTVEAAWGTAGGQSRFGDWVFAYGGAGSKHVSVQPNAGSVLAYYGVGGSGGGIFGAGSNEVGTTTPTPGGAPAGLADGGGQGSSYSPRVAGPSQNGGGGAGKGAVRSAEAQFESAAEPGALSVTGGGGGGGGGAENSWGNTTTHNGRDGGWSGQNWGGFGGLGQTGTSGTDGGAGIAVASGAGGGGGSYNSAGAGGSGGNGGIPSGGGGGGGKGTTSGGAGGAGGRGQVTVITYF